MSIINPLKKAGAQMNITDQQIEISRSDLKAFEFDATESPDLFPPLVALASYCEGVSAIKGVSRLIYKESDRAKTLKEEFGKMNIKIEIHDDHMHVTGGKPLSARVESHDDTALLWLSQSRPSKLQEKSQSGTRNALQNLILVSLMI
jgi:3-phosphoshikimate 1-carboxyvinyltransferase